MHQWKKIAEEEEKLRVAVVKSNETEGWEFTRSREKKRQANYDKIDHKEVVEEERSACVRAAGRNRKTEIFIMILYWFIAICCILLHLYPLYFSSIVSHNLYIIWWVSGMFWLQPAQVW